jgi:hypothetical protein
MPAVNYLAVLVSAIAIFLLGGLWYSPVMFAKRWAALQNRTAEEMKAAGASPAMFVQVFLCGFVTAWALEVVLNHFMILTIPKGIGVGVVCWLGFAAATSYGTALFSAKPKALWIIDSGYNLVSIVVASVILTVWR